MAVIGTQKRNTEKQFLNHSVSNPGPGSYNDPRNIGSSKSQRGKYLLSSHVSNSIRDNIQDVQSKAYSRDGNL